MTNINELRRLAQAATPGPWIAKNVSGAGLEIHMSHPVYPDKEWPAFGTDSAFCKKGLVSYETWTHFPHEVQNVQQSKNAEFIAAANPAVIDEILDRLEAAEKDIALKESVIDSLGSELNAVATERDKLKELNSALCTNSNSQVIHNARLAEENYALRARIEEMEKQKPVGWQRLYKDGSGSEDFTDLPDVFERQRPLYALPGAKGE